MSNGQIDIEQLKCNAFEEAVLTLLIKMSERLNHLEKKNEAAADLIPFPLFVKENGINRKTAYNWVDAGKIKITKIGGRVFVLRDSILIDSRYQRIDDGK